MTLYDWLGVSPVADFAELRRAYQHALRTWRADRFAAASPAVRARAEAERRRVAAAWEILSDPRRRAEYDATLGLRPVAGERPGRHPNRCEPARLPGLEWLRRQPSVRPIAVFVAIVALIVAQYAYAGALLATHLVALVLLGSFFWWVGHLERG